MAQKRAKENIQSEQLIQKSIFDKKVKKNSSEINEGDLIIYRNMLKHKKNQSIRGTKDQPKYVGPLTAHEVTDTFVTIDPVKKSRRKKIPLGITRLYCPHSDLTQIKKKRISELPPTCVSYKKTKTIKVKVKKTIEEKAVNWIYGIEKETLLDELKVFKTTFSELFTKGGYLSELHEQLELEFSKKGVYAPDTFIFDFLKDTTTQSMRREIIYDLLDFTKQLFPEMGGSRSSDYVFKVLYGVAMEHLGNKLIDVPLNESLFDLLHLSSDDPTISYPTIEWQKEKCNLLQIKYETDIEQHHSLNGQKLKKIKPWRCIEIKGDGNCLFT